MFKKHLVKIQLGNDIRAEFGTLGEAKKWIDYLFATVSVKDNGDVVPAPRKKKIKKDLVNIWTREEDDILISSLHLPASAVAKIKTLKQRHTKAAISWRMSQIKTGKYDNFNTDRIEYIKSQLALRSPN